jgi:MarR family transcriptional regulator, organic hydroperoxide resistance regulator
MAKPSSPVLEQMLCFDLYAASRAVIKAYGPLLERLNLTYPQYLVLVLLWQEEPMSVAKLSNRLSLDSGTLSPLLKRLEAAGLVVRERSKADERSVDVRLTESGRALEQQASAVLQEMGQLMGLQSDVVCDLQRVLRSLARRVQGIAADGDS